MRHLPDANQILMLTRTDKYIFIRWYSILFECIQFYSFRISPFLTALKVPRIGGTADPRLRVRRVSGAGSEPARL